MDSAQRRTLHFIAVLTGYALLGGTLLWLFWALRAIWPPFFVAFVLAIALAPVVDRLETRGWPRWLGTLTVYAGLFAASAALLFVLVPIVSGQIAYIVADLRERFRLDQPADISRTLSEQVRIFGIKNEIPAFIMAPIVQQAKNSATLLTSGLETLGALLVSLGPSLIWVVLVPIIAFYALVDYHRIFAKILLLVPKASRDAVRSVASDVTVVFGRYLRGLGIVCLLNTLATILVLLLFEPTRPYAAALGLIAGILYAVPYLGAILSTVLIALVAFASPDQGSLAMMLTVTASMLILHQVLFDQVITPRLLGGLVGLHPILSILALMGGNALFGVGGMLLAVPTAASIQVIILHILPRLARTVEVKIQEEAPPIQDPALSDGNKTVEVAAGDGVVGTPAPKAGAALSETSNAL